MPTLGNMIGRLLAGVAGVVLLAHVNGVIAGRETEACLVIVLLLAGGWFLAPRLRAVDDRHAAAAREPLPQPTASEQQRLRRLQGEADVAMTRGSFEAAETARLEAEQLVAAAIGTETVRQAALLAKQIAKWQTVTFGSAAPPRKSYV